MVRKTLFIMTHVGSGWEALAERLQGDSRFHVFNTGLGYHHPDDVRALASLIHPRDNSAAVWVDVVLHNKDFTLKRLMPHYHLLFWSREFEKCREDLLLHGYGPSQADDYYMYRLEGMRQYWERRVKRGLSAPWNPSLEGNAVFAAVP
jgi:hypothetical protein